MSKTAWPNGKYGDSRLTSSPLESHSARDGREAVLEARDGLRPVHPVRFVAFALTNSNTQDGPSAGQQVQRRRGLCGDGRIAPTRVCDTQPESETADAVVSGEVAEHRPGLKVCVRPGSQPRNPEVLRRADGSRKQ